MFAKMTMFASLSLLAAMIGACAGGHEDAKAPKEEVSKTVAKTALFVRLEAKPGQEKALADFLSGARTLVEAEPDTTTWYAIKLGPSTFGIYDTFPGDEGRKAHLAGKVAAALSENASALLASPPSIEHATVLAAKLLPDPVKVGLMVRLEAKPGKEAEVESFVKNALPVVEEEPGTAQWFGIALGPSTFGIYDTFAGDEGRKAHLAGKVAAALGDKAPELLASSPTIEQVEVLAAKLPR
ncbi:MAG: hypothetical protein MUF34_07435 [Polyangiaceae bacterium]|jgi:quinol monooxygenase YgiN|nr:hypothetical protein [Polyangiaceae bacterium]